MKVFVVTCMLMACAFAAPSTLDNQVNNEDSSFSHVMKFFGSCSESGDMATCLAVKGITALNRAARAQNIEILPGVQFTRDASVSARSGKALSENDIVAALPADAEEKNGRLFDMALESASSFFGSHNLQVNLPAEATQSVARAIEEGRKKKKLKKIIGPLLLGIGAKLFALLPLLIGGLALLVFKALIVSKIAFLLAGVLAISKLIGGGSKISEKGAGGLGGIGGGLGAGLGGLSALGGLLGGLGGGSGGGAGLAQGGGYSTGGGGGQGWQQGGGGGGSGGGSYPYARSYDAAGQAQELAYSAQAPAE